MIFVILFAIVGAAIVILASNDAIDAFFGAIVGAALSGLLGLLVALFVGAAFYSGHSVQAQPPVKLESLVDGSDLRGRFFLGSGTINDVATYTWYEQTKDNTFVQQTADADIAQIHFLPSGSERRPYYILHEDVTPDGPFLDTWGVRVNAGRRYPVSYDFYVPKGTITRQFELDAQ